MNKEEILAKSRKENQSGDEMTKARKREADQNAFLAIVGVNTFLFIILTFQKFFMREMFTDFSAYFVAFYLAFFVGTIGNFTTRYKYTREKGYLFGIVLNLVGSFACLMLIIGKGIGWF